MFWPGKMYHTDKPIIFFLLAFLQGMCSFAAADVIHVTSGISVTPGSSDALIWDIDGNGTTDFSFTYISFGLGAARDMNDPGFNDSGTGEMIVLTEDPQTFIPEVTANLPARFSISDTLPDNYQYLASKGTFVTPELDTTSGFEANVPGYVGFRFLSGTDYRYGWAKLMFVIPDPPSSDPGALYADAPGITIFEWAYEDSGGPLSVPVPEPASSAFLAGTACIAMLRRSRQKRRSRATPG